MTQFKKITRVIYDLDGLLLDTEPIHAQVNQMMAARYGKTYDPSIQLQITGRNAFDSARLLVERLGLPLNPEAYLNERRTIISGLFPDAKPLLGAVRLTQHLHRYRIPQAVATSSARPFFDLKTTHHQDWFALFECIVTGDDAAIEQGKPAPDIFLITAQRLGVLPEQCLVFEDSLAGVEAALAAGMSVIAVPAPSVDKQLYQHAHQVLDSLSHFEPHLWQLPAF